VGRASSSEPLFICLELRGGSDNEDFLSLVGKGVCFDSGGLNLKSSGSIKGMHIDKHGACSVLSAFESAAKLQIKSNIVAVLGVV
jgi:leucyl aminopeptidase